MNLFHVNSQTTLIATTYAYYGCTLDNHEFWYAWSSLYIGMFNF